jgi:DNA replication licensing factor MCM4
VQSRIYNLREAKVIRDLNPADINKLISVSGMVTRTSGVIPDQRCERPGATPLCHMLKKAVDRQVVAGPSNRLLASSHVQPRFRA